MGITPDHEHAAQKRGKTFIFIWTPCLKVVAKAKNVSISNLINQSINGLHVIDTNEMDKLEEMNRILIEIYNIREYLNRLEISNEYILLLLVRIETCLQKYLKED